VTSRQGTITGYRASPGWDPVTGWGSPDAQEFVSRSWSIRPDCLFGGRATLVNSFNRLPQILRRVRPGLVISRRPLDSEERQAVGDAGELDVVAPPLKPPSVAGLYSEPLA
jgi:hypothetical protein